MERLSSLKWERVRHLILSTNPFIFDNDGERAWREITFHRGIGNLVKNLERTEGINIVDWITFVEWYENGFPHWHLFIEVDQAGKEGMIGEKSIHRFWPWGIIIKELYIKNVAHWNNLTGYFDGHGYFEIGKGYQGELPAWGKSKNVRIKRYETKKQKRGVARLTQDKTLGEGQYTGMGIVSGKTCPSLKSPMRNYNLILGGCGAQSKLTVSTDGSTNSFTLPIKYRIMKLSCGWEYVEGKGLFKSLSEEGYLSLIERVTKLQWIVDTLERESRASEGAADRMGARPLEGSEPSAGDGVLGVSPLWKIEWGLSKQTIDYVNSLLPAEIPQGNLFERCQTFKMWEYREGDPGLLLSEQDEKSRSSYVSKVPVLSGDDFAILRALYRVAPGGSGEQTAEDDLDIYEGIEYAD